jgi:hypothetical protein
LRDATDMDGESSMLSFFNKALVACGELRESHRFATAMLVILATGIVAASVIFGLLEGVLLRELLIPLPRWTDLFGGAPIAV